MRLHVFDQHREFVTAEARQQRARARSRTKSFRHDLQYAVAEVVSQRVVDGLEVVEVDEHQREVLPGRSRARVARRPGESRAVADSATEASGS